MRSSHCLPVMIFAALLVALGFSGSAEAQTILTVDLNKAQLQWDWTQGTGGAVDEFRMYCGPQAGQYTKTTVLTNPAARTLAVKDAITGSGNWFCAVSAANRYGESVKSNEVPFDAGAIPSSPTNNRVTAQ